ncbi:hypothetical protein C8J55DRAFT_489517 [Lentinula edodes]|uniref:Uncharacterized protein n=1 Tax=Lentinula lateritia TaxID=40482 RepID=A0A9W9AB36_9AGAR|nr:hypothetical protein C8J55DRAFT_489517 [Lentinula edodes]
MYPVPAYPSHTRNHSQLLTKWTTMMKSEGKGPAPHHIEVNASCTLSTRDDVTQTIMKNSLYQHEGIVSDIVARHILNEMIRLGETEGIIKRLCPQLAPEIYDFFTEVGRLYCAMVINLPNVICPYQRQPHLEINIRGAYLRWKRLDACRFNDKVAVFMNNDIRFWFQWEYELVENESFISQSELKSTLSGTLHIYSLSTLLGRYTPDPKVFGIPLFQDDAQIKSTPPDLEGLMSPAQNRKSVIPLLKIIKF